jgi:hypothetical protein
MAVIESFKPTRQPNIAAASPTIAVKTPIINNEQKKHSQPPQMCGGGTKAKATLRGKNY